MRVSEQVENLLKYIPKTRDSDKELLIAYMQKFGLELSNKQIELFKRMPAPETITRCRRILQEQGKYSPSEEVDRLRHDKFLEMRQNPGYVILNEGNYGN